MRSPTHQPHVAHHRFALRLGLDKLRPVRIGDAQRWLAAIVDSSDDAIVGKRLDGTIVSWNAGAQRIFGYTSAEIIGESVLTLFPPELKDEERAIIAQIVRGERVDHYESTRLHKDGTRIAVSISVSPILDGSGAIIGAAKIARDITEAKRMREALRVSNEKLEEQQRLLEDQLTEYEELAAQLEETNERLENAVAAARISQKEAEAANRVKSDFLAIMSHELRTPLNAISGYADLMDADVSGTLSPEHRGYVEKIRRSQRHLLELISGVLDFSRADAGRLEVSVDKTSVDALLAHVEPMVLPQARAKEQHLRIVHPATPLYVLCDEDRTIQILLNLVANAIKFTSPGGYVSLDTHDTGDAIVSIRVRDNGPGVAPEDRDRIFEPFVQADRSLTRGHGGVGLGLAISREFARAMGGDVILEDTSPSGSSFVLTLKRA
jgi:PAS domain S-box-containing protein